MAGMGLTQMNSLLTSANTMKHVTDLDKNRGVLQRNMQALAKEIASAKEAGVDTSAKEEKYSQMENNLNSNTEDIFSTGKELTERIARDSEKIRVEEAEQARQEQRAGEKADAANIGQSGETVGSADVKTSTDVTTDPTIGITEPVDTVKISPEAKALATANTERTEHKPAPHPSVQTPSSGKTLDKKV